MKSSNRLLGVFSERSMTVFSGESANIVELVSLIAPRVSQD